jgi:hypothetical protein
MHAHSSKTVNRCQSNPEFAGEQVPLKLDESKFVFDILAIKYLESMACGHGVSAKY